MFGHYIMPLYKNFFVRQKVSFLSIVENTDRNWSFNKNDQKFWSKTNLQFL